MRNEFENQQAGILFLWGVVCSVGIHLLVLFMRINYAPLALQQPSNEETPIEITEVPKEWLQSPPPQKTKKKRTEPQIAETEKIENDKLDPNSTILSDRNQTTEKQMKAKNIDDFREKQGTGVKQKAQEGPSGLTPTGDPTGETVQSPLDLEDGVGISKKEKGIKRDWRTLSLKDLSVRGDGGPQAATDDYLNNVAEGDRTVLSTREFRYFSYYHRIKELLRQYWKPAVERKVSLIWAKGKTIRSEELTTQLLILLDKKGAIRKISRVGSSGMKDVDNAAIEAFQKAAPFPNPPKGIIDPDGFVRIRWDFILKAQTAPRIQFQRNPTARPMDRY